MELPRGDQVSFTARPLEGRVVRDPYTGVPLPEQGTVVPNNQYWRRRVRAGEIEIVSQDESVLEDRLDFDE